MRVSLNNLTQAGEQAKALLQWASYWEVLNTQAAVFKQLISS